MKRVKSAQLYLLLAAILGVAAIVGCSVPVVDLTAPTVSSTLPGDFATDVALNSDVTVTFSEAMDPATIVAGTISLAKEGTTAVAGSVTSEEEIGTFTPDSDLEPDSFYTATVSVVAADTSGNKLAESYSWTFVTGAAPDVTAPVVISTIPSNLAEDVDISNNITATFNEAMDPATIIAANFTVADGLVPVAGTVIYDVPTQTASFAPEAILDNNTEYTVTITSDAADLTSNGLAADKVWTFTTTASAGAGPAPVRLGTAGNFVILAKTAITTVPTSVITGDIGVSPAAESYMTGFSQTKATGYSTSDQVTGFMYAADMTPPTPSNMTTSISDMETAYVDAAGRSTSPVMNLDAGLLNSATDPIVPGLYTWGTGVLITENISIDGAANDVWIFQIANNLEVSSAVNIILSGGAQAKNIFWQVAGYVELGTTSHFEGIILCMTQINFLTGATMNGRALAQTQVTLDQNAVTEPAQ